MKSDRNRKLALVALSGSQDEDTLDDLSPELYLYRDRTLALLRRYFRLSMELGRVPALLGREFFRARVTSYRMHNFEDVVIFVHDVDRCLERLDEFSRRLIARVALQEHTQAEAARLLGCTHRTVERRFPQAVDALTQILIEKKLLRSLDQEERRPRRSLSGLPPRKPVGRVFACQDPKIADFPVSCSTVTK